MKDNRTKAEIIKLHQQSISEINEKHKAKVSEMTDSYQKLFSDYLTIECSQKNAIMVRDKAYEDLQKEKRENWDLIDKLKKKDSEIRNVRLTQLSQMEAVKMLFDLMASGHTHRSKEMFVMHAKMVIDKQIEEIRRYKFGDDNPF